MSLRILIVDDDKLIRDLLPAILAGGLGMRPPPVVETAGTPEGAERALAPRAPDERLVVLCDYNLKTTRNGLDVLGHVKEARPDATRILFSGHTRREIRGIDAADIHGFIEKPFRLQEVVPPLRAILDARAATAEAQGSSIADAARRLDPDEVVPALVRAATKGESGRTLALYDEAQRRGKQPEAEREATRALVWQNRVLELVAAGAPLEDTLAVLAHAVEEQAPGLLASVLLLDATGTKLLHGAAPSLPEAYNRALHGLPVGSGIGSCGTAAHERRAVVVTDTQTDPLWAEYRALARSHGLGACWSVPIVSPGGRMFGTFSLYARGPRSPTQAESELLELGASLARVAIESHQDRLALRASETRYRTLFNSIDAGFCVLEVLFDAQERPVDLRYVEVNDAFSAQAGIEDVVGRTVRELRPALEERWYARYGEVARTGTPTRFEEYSAAFGRWFDVYAFRVGDPQSRQVGVLFNDVTRRKRVEAEKEELLARERAARAEAAAARERLRGTILQAPIAMALLVGPEHVCELANAEYERASGRPASEHVGRTVREVYPEIDPAFYALLDRVYATGEPYVGHEVLVRLRRQGALVDAYMDFLYQPARGADGKVEGIIVVVHDVTDKVRAREVAETSAAQLGELLARERASLAEAAAQRRRLHDLFQQAPAAIAIVDGPDYVFSFVNPRYCELVEMREDELVGRPVAEALPEVVEQGFIGLLDRVRTTGEPFRAESTPVTLRNEGGSRTLYLNFAYQPVFAEGEFVSIMAHAVDVTAQVLAQRRADELAATLEARVNERTRELVQTNRDLESFSYVVSHDLRAPLRAVHHLVDLALEDLETSPGKARESLVAARASTFEMARLIESLLSLARAGQGDLRVEDVDVTALGRAVVAELRAADPARRVDVRIHDGLWARADARLLRSVLDNLLGNAWKFTGASPRAAIEMGRSGNAFFVRDNGVGFDMTEAAALFQPFRRLATAEGFEGTGIGLATVRRIVERHGGRVWVEAKPAQGATFWFTLERAAPDA